MTDNRDAKTTRDTICRECGMELYGWDEFHPQGACEMFKHTRNAGAVRLRLQEEKDELDACIKDAMA